MIVLVQGTLKMQATSVFLRLRNDLYCVEWGVKLYSLTHSVLTVGKVKVSQAGKRIEDFHHL